MWPIRWLSVIQAGRAPVGQMRRPASSAVPDGRRTGLGGVDRPASGCPTSGMSTRRQKQTLYYLASIINEELPRSAKKNTHDLSGDPLNSDHDRLAPIFLAIVGDGSFVVGKPLEIKDGLTSRRSEKTTHPVGDHFLALSVRAQVLFARDQGHIDPDLTARRCWLRDGALQSSHY